MATTAAPSASAEPPKSPASLPARTSELDARDRAAITSVDQIDMDVLNELPDDLKKEVLANARTREPKRKGGKTRGAIDRFFAK